MSIDHTKTSANPDPPGLPGLGMTTVLPDLHNADFLPLAIVIIAMGITMSSPAQIIAGIRELCQGNTFGGIHAITTIACFEGIFCGLSAIYSAIGQILNAEDGKASLPLG